MLPGAKEAVLFAKQRGLVGLATNSSSEYLDRFLDKSGLREHFNIAVSAKTLGAFKPKPDIYLHTCKLLGVQPNETVVIEDSLTGMQAAKDAGCIVIGIQKNPGLAAKQLCKQIVSTIEDVPAILQKI